MGPARYQEAVETSRALEVDRDRPRSQKTVSSGTWGPSFVSAGADTAVEDGIANAHLLIICDGLRRIPLVTPDKLSAGPIDASTEREGPSSRAGAFRGYGRTDGAMAFFGLASRKCSSFEHLRRSTDTRW